MTWDIFGHAWAVDLLQEHIKRNAVRHAYLLTGPRGLGRRTLALRFAQALNCMNPPSPGEACGDCRACQQIARQQHPDLGVVSSAQVAGSQIRVEQIRELQRSLALTPYEAKYRVALLLNFEEATASTANALLKTLEEPASQVVMLLTAESPERLLPTIVSRCEVMRLRPIGLDDLSQDLQERLNLPLLQADLLAHLAGGRPGYAIRLHQESELLEQRKAWLDEHIVLISQGRLARFAWVNSVYREKDAVLDFLQVFLSFWRDILLRAAGSLATPVNLDRSSEIAALAKRIELGAAHQAVKRLEQTLALLERNVNTRLALEVLMLDLPRIKS